MARRLAGFLWPAAALACALAAWLFLPRARTDSPPRARLVVALVDVSASVSRARAWLPWVRAELRELATQVSARGDELAVLSFADGVATGFGPGEPARFLESLAGQGGAPFDSGQGLARGATRLSEALAAAEGLLDARPAGELWLLAPASYTGASPSGALARLAAAGTRFVVRAPPRPEAGDLGLLELELAPRVEAGAPLVARLRLVWRCGSEPPARATLALEVECDARTRTLERELAPPGVDGPFELALDCGPAELGRNEVRARCRLGSGPDLFPENDRARASTTAGDARVVGVVRGPELGAEAEAWLAPAGRSALTGLQFVFLAPEALAPELDGLDALVSLDLAPADLPEALLASFVQRGGGWLALAGFGFLRDWSPGEAGGALHTLLPAEPAPREAPPRDVVLLVDGSGSMEGAPFESVRAAALELVSAALPSDRVSLRFFTVGLEREHVLKERSASRREDQESARRAAGELLALRVPAGSTHLLASLRELGQQESGGAHETLVLLLSDGFEREGLVDPLGLAAEIRDELERARARLVVIAVGEANLPLLSALAGAPELVRSGATLAELRAVFQRELLGPRLAEGELPVRLAARAPGSLADQVVSAGTSVALAPLERYVRNRLRPGGEALWTSAEGEPLLALGRAGLGRVALFASRPGAGWASRYTRTAPGEPAGFEGVLRWLARGPAREVGPEARLEGGRLRVRGLGPDAPAELAARVSVGGEERAELTLLPPADAAPRLDARESRWDGPWPAGALLVLAPEAPGAPSRVLAVASALPDEYAWGELRAELPGTSAEPARTTPRRIPSAHPAAPWVLAVALGLVLAAGLASARGQGVRGFGR
jgi:Mg-chelatase subunit ChlD